MPHPFTQLRLRVRSLFRRTEVDQELDEELQYHLDRQIEEGIAQGLSRDEAHRAALRALGAITQNREQSRGARGVNWIENTIQDLRYGARTLRKNLAFSIVAVLVLALGIGANTAMFSVAYGMLLRPLPYPDSDRVAVVFMSYSPRDFRFGTMSIRDYLIWTQENRAFENPSLFRTLRMDIGAALGLPEQVQGASVTAGFFSTLGVQPLIGRTFRAEEEKPGAASRAVLSESIWRRRFGASSDVLGQTMLVNGVPSVITGVMRDTFRFPSRSTEVWTNLPLNPPSRYGPWFYRGVARLKPGITLEQAQAESTHIASRMMQENPFYKRLTFPMLSLREALLGNSVKPALLVLAGAVGLVLLIAVVNVANLMLARATVRQREMALRLSLGAARSRLVRQLLTESVMLSIMGGVAGLALAWGGVRLIRAWNPGDLPLIDSVRLDWTALSFTILVSVFTGILFGLAPAFASARTDLNSAIKEGGRTGAAGQTRGRTRAILVIAEIATSLMLLVGAGLLLRSFINLQGVTGGFSTPPKQILTMLISPGNAKYKEARAGTAFYNEVLRRARNLPGVEMAALTDSLPPDRQGDADSFAIEGQSLAPGEMNPIVSVVTATSDLFRALRVPLVKGRYFTEHDNQDSPPVTIVSEGFERRFFPNQDAVGKRIKHSGPGSDEDWMQIVGVVGNVKYLGLAVDTDPAYYMPFGQTYYTRMFLVVRASGDADPLAALLRPEIQSIDPGVTLAQVGTMEQALNLSVSQPRFDTLLLALFAGIALLLAAVGIYGLISYSVVQRTHEIGVRMALGAAQADIVRMVVRQGVLLAAIGIALGLGGAFALTHLLAAMLFGIGVNDPLTFAAAPLGMLFVVLLATFVPALRATRISPVVAFRE
ncbi:MAG TPA: ABC transporter permease [Bryobacteraceae bacterium]|nr:ABC transporter permease [Bryobacteraceae bacterium]